MIDDLNDSLKAGVKQDLLDSPRPSSLMFVRQFARVYVSIDKSKATPLIMN